MKKLISLIAFILVLLIFPVQSIQAKMAVETKDEYKTQIREKRKIIKAKARENSKIEAIINKRSRQITDLYDVLFKEQMAPNEEKMREIEARENEVTKIVQHLVHIDKTIVKEGKSFQINLRNKNFELALNNLDRIIALLEKKYDLLQIHATNLQDYIEYLKNLRLK